MSTPEPPEPGPTLPVVHSDGLPAEAHRLAAQALELVANRRAAATRRAYESDFAHFADWCSAMGLSPLPATPEAVYLYLSALVADDNAASYAITTLDRRLDLAASARGRLKKSRSTGSRKRQ